MSAPLPQTADGWHKPQTRDDLARLLGEITRKAGGLVLDAVARGFKHYAKADGSQYTDADVAAEEYILATLAQQFPAIPVIAEEQTAMAGKDGIPQTDVGHVSAFFLVDPLDGTREFIEGGQEYTVNIAAILNGAPVAGAVYAPASGRLWIGGAHAFRTICLPEGPSADDAPWTPIATRPAASGSLSVVASARHGCTGDAAFLKTLGTTDQYAASSSVKFCVVAEGRADVYPRFGATMEWDTAAGDAVLRAAGGMVTDLAGAPLTYGHTPRGFCNGPFVAWGDPAFGAEHLRMHPDFQHSDSRPEHAGR